MTTYEVIKIAGFWINSDNPDPSNTSSDNYDDLTHQFVVLNSGEEVDCDNDQIFFWSSSASREDFVDTHGMRAWESKGSPKDGCWEWVCTGISPDKFTWSEADGLCMVYDV